MNRYMKLSFSSEGIVSLHNRSSSLPELFVSHSTHGNFLETDCINPSDATATAHPLTIVTNFTNDQGKENPKHNKMDMQGWQNLLDKPKETTQSTLSLDSNDSDAQFRTPCGSFADEANMKAARRNALEKVDMKAAQRNALEKVEQKRSHAKTRRDSVAKLKDEIQTLKKQKSQNEEHIEKQITRQKIDKQLAQLREELFQQHIRDLERENLLLKSQMEKMEIVGVQMYKSMLSSSNSCSSLCDLVLMQNDDQDTVCKREGSAAPTKPTYNKLLQALHLTNY